MGQGAAKIASGNDAQAVTPSSGSGQGSKLAQPLAAQAAPAGVLGLDVSGHQADADTHSISQVNWSQQWSLGGRFVYAKATEGNYFVDASRASQLRGAASVGMIRGAYHFAIPQGPSSAVEQADFFVRNGGGWSADGWTLPPLLDIEYNPYSVFGNICYNLSSGAMVNWIKAFSNRVQALTGRLPMIYTTTDWWTQCTGNSSEFGNQPLHIAAYSSWIGALPKSWSFQTVWQYSSTGPFAGDSNTFNGGMDQLKALAYGTPGIDPVAIERIQAAAAANPSIGGPLGQVACGLANGGCFRMFSNGAIVWSLATGAQLSPSGPIRDAWGAQGFENGILSYPTSSIICGLANGGCYQAYAGGEILSSSATGAQVSRAGEIRTAYRMAGAENGSLGYPTGPETCGLVDGGCYQMFQHGAIIWSSSTGARISPMGPIRSAWGENQFESGKLGYPTSNVVCGLVKSGCYQTFESGAILDSPMTGSQLSLYGPIRTAWGASGFESGPLGYPTAPQICSPTPDSCYQTFQGGTVTWTTTFGSHYVTGGINSGWLASGGAGGPIGYPSGTPVCGMIDDGCYQAFQTGYVIWNRAVGGQMSINGPIRDAWQKTGYESGPLAYPSTSVVCGLVDGGCYQNYQGGAIIWSASTGAQPSFLGPIRTAWQQQGFETGPLKYPSSDKVCGLRNGGCYQDFQGGAIIWSPATGAQTSLTGPIRTAWQAKGFETGSLGYPTGAQSCNPSLTSCSQKYQGGQINWSTSQGVWFS